MDVNDIAALSGADQAALANLLGLSGAPTPEAILAALNDTAKISAIAQDADDFNQLKSIPGIAAKQKAI